ncbi:hypothetical protein CEXT_735681 [Caerostris extrusa]|uniref:Uncharacterized protein n=1 Tax=Caerostris extrusa TaxID=172846 RepID=A0AAV4VYI1_CAEEX|nr:hypothetical protein CEXT_735681 [Caerostris extrusa]
MSSTPTEEPKLEKRWETSILWDTSTSIPMAERIKTAADSTSNSLLFFTTAATHFPWCQECAATCMLCSTTILGLTPAKCEFVGVECPDHLSFLSAAAAPAGRWQQLCHHGHEPRVLLQAL